MRRSFAGLVAFASLAVGSLLLHACEDSARPTDPDLATTGTTRRSLTVTGDGNGSGTVTSSPVGINCAINLGTAATSGCTARFNDGAVVTLTAKPKAGHAFRGWFSGSCSGTAACKVTMSQGRTVEARFLKGPFAIKIAGSGSGSGRVTTQAGLTPALDCTITNGVAATTGCSATYPANTTLTLTATSAGGSGFTGWSAPCAGTAPCRYDVVQSRTISAAFGASGGGGSQNSASTQGKWGAPFATPIVAIHMHLLPTGKVLLWGHQGDAQIWDPAAPNAGFTRVSKAYPVFCSGHTFLADGRLLVAGGSIDGPRGEARAALYDAASGAWSLTGSMAQGRYYPTLTALPDGRALAVSGNDENRDIVTIPEVFDGTGWRRLTSAPLAIGNPFYPDMFVAPNGRVFLAGFPEKSAYLDLSGTGAWTPVATRRVADRTMGSAVMYAPGKILYAGGGDPPTSSAEVIDLNAATPAWRTVASMHFARRQMNATILADGRVLVTHGTGGPGFNDVTSPVFQAELWNPATEAWTVMASEAVGRTYHSTAVLLPDARVLSSGSGEGAGISFENSKLSAQIYSPPYLYAADGTLAPRPRISSAPASLGYSQTLSVETDDAATVHRGTLVRLSSVTHAFNQSQLAFPLTFTAAGATTLRAQGPGNANLAPPGPYMLFLINDRGVPSQARMLTIHR
jgi:hypothetical protein